MDTTQPTRESVHEGAAMANPARRATKRSFGHLIRRQGPLLVHKGTLADVQYCFCVRLSTHHLSFQRGRPEQRSDAQQARRVKSVLLEYGVSFCAPGQVASVT